MKVIKNTFNNKERTKIFLHSAGTTERPRIYKKDIKHAVGVSLFVLSNEFVQEFQHRKERLHCRGRLSSKMSQV